ncbi:hypothetical protein M409DRAFT_61010 [Zasmidium cellare ATCC 36951]|uniref:Uncharacterized protein n=1 Tax=Zasmidium cellare ATCC 36951 TaxID=1080233 RepID=A0A6A6BWH4_ZASCE|nr:uncharacterized protein M409DRAFT_61010 [Zasmidium cellare ATCC 36951]KAF2159184.1 hypothetical protein M409DRAFT_61010 [Zasmidium cellare ATCC 36951]
MAAHLCCTHPRQLESPTPPYRPPPGIDETIFAVASLPSDHPHALRFLPRRRHSEVTRVGGGILRSPRLVDKVRMRLGRRSRGVLREGFDGVDEEVVDMQEGELLGSLPRSGRYDEDARVLGSVEVLEGGPGEDVSESRPLRKTRSAYPLIGQAITTTDGESLSPLAVASPKMRARGKSNSSFSIGALLSRAGAGASRGGSGDENTDPSARVSNGDASGQYGQDGLPRSQSSHLDPVAIRRAIECTSAMSADSGADHPDIQGYLDAHPWNISRSPTPPLPTGSTRRAEGYSPSVYTRPGTSAEDAPFSNIPNDLNATVCAEWPLKAHDDQADTSKQSNTPRLSAQSLQNKPLPPTPVAETTTTASSSTSPVKSPPRKTVKKRRSIFRFLRPGSRRQQFRSISSPMLLTRPSTSRSGAYDGPGDERDRRDTLTVQYELTENPMHRRSFTATNTPQERRPTLVEYERNLTFGGDNRRRPSVITPSAVSAPNLQKLHDISEDEVEEEKSSRLRRKLSRAHALDEAGKTLMGQALKKHQQEKAMFRSESKRRESLAQHNISLPIFTSSFGPAAGSSLPPPSIREHNELLDPLDQTGLKPSESATTLLELPQAGGSTPMRKPSVVTTFDESPRGQRKAATTSSTSPSKRQPSSTSPRIGTSLASWSKFPSHTRIERCSSAGRIDNVITRDFANVDPSTAPISPLSKSSTTRGSRKSNRSLIRSPSRAFSNLVQYYKDMLSRGEGFRGANRRTSVSANTGSVAHPELEMVSPMPGAEAHHHHMNHAHLHELEEHLERSIAEHIHHPQPSPPKIAMDKGKAPANDLFRQETFHLRAHSDSPTPPDEDEEGPGPLDGATEWSRQNQQSCLQQRPRSSASSSAVSSVRIRKFPSVTVLDDWKGHRASVSLLSRCDGQRVGSLGGGLERGSTRDLLEELVRREREERERALGLGFAGEVRRGVVVG